MDFYDKQINRLEASEKLKEFDIYINDYINADSLELRNTLKEIILSKAESELSQTELKVFRDDISQKARNETWNTKLKLYELTAWLYNLSSTQDRLWNIEVNDIPPFEVAWWTIERNARVIWWNITKPTIKKVTEKYDIVWSNIVYLWDKKYEITLNWQIPWKYADIRQEVILRYRWWNTVEIFDNRWQSIQIVPIRNKREVVQSWRLNNEWRFHIKTQEKNDYIEFSIQNRSIKIHLELTFNDR